MSNPPRKKSPRAPSIALDEALERALRAYDRDRLHPAPTEVFAQNIGYKSANNGAALGVLASLRYYGLVERPSDGMLAVTKNVESFKFSPDDEMKRSLLLEFLRTPPLFNELLEKYSSGLPSDANLRYELIQRGFSPSGAESVLAAFRRSVSFAGFFATSDAIEVPQAWGLSENQVSTVQAIYPSSAPSPSPSPSPVTETNEGVDRIPVRLPGGRKAWLVIPTPFYAADKDRIKAQIDLLLTAEDDD